MGRKAKYLGGVGERGLGMELRQYRQQAQLTLEKVGDVLGWSANTISRLERGLRPETTAEEVSAMLAVMGVTGVNRDRVLRMAKGYRDQGWWEDNSEQFDDQARTYLKFERRATRIVDVEPLLVPGLLQTPEYYRALLQALGTPDEEAEDRIRLRLSRQAMLSSPLAPELVFVVSELMLRRPLGGPAVMARQLRRLCEEAAERPRVSVRAIPADVVAHPALHGAFVVLEFADEPTVVFLEGRRSAMYPENPKEIEIYMMAAERLTRLALDDQKSLQLLRSIGRDLERSG